ncbi:MAG: hypothetical protein AAGH46_12715, partial [Bacteroidota bacterium]
SIPLAAWPSKGKFITTLLETVNNQGKTNIAEVLKTSMDPATSKIGHHIFNALSATSMKAAIPHYYGLTEMLPNFNGIDIEIIFNRPFKSFRHNSSLSKNDPNFTRRLTFNDRRNFFVSGDLVIGIYDTRTTIGGKEVPPHLLAYNMKTEKMEWGLPLTPTSIEKLQLNTTQRPMSRPAGYYLDRAGQYITLQFDGHKNIDFINASSGEINTSILMPYEKRQKYDCFHLIHESFGYQIVNIKRRRKLIGGIISDSKLKPVFEVETPSGSFLPLSTHAGFLFRNKLVLFSPTGKSVSFDCLSAKAYGNKLYLIETGPEGTCKLTIRTMTADDSVVTLPEKTVILKEKEISIDCLCDNRQIILFHKNLSNKSPIFVSLDNEKIVYVDHKMEVDAKQVVNTATGELWEWDETSKKIWKISSKETVLMGSLESGRGTILLHADESDHLYFVEIPF